MASPVKAALGVMLISLLGIPATYFVNTAQTLRGEVGLLVSGVVSLAAICALTYFVLTGFDQPKDWLFYVFTLSTFSSVVDLIIGLELDGFVSGFMTNYLKKGEPYLATPYGGMICYWDGTVHYVLYIAMLTAMACRWRYREIGLYWVGSIGHSMLVLVPGAILSKYGVRWSFLLNIPYIFIPFLSARRFIRERIVESPVENKALIDKRSIWQRPFDLLLIGSLVISFAIAFLRGFAALGGSYRLTRDYISLYEPYLEDPVAFPKMQMLVYMYYFVPFYVLAIYALLYRGCTWLPDWALIFAGAAAQAQVPHIVSSLHSRTPAEYHVPHDGSLVFWLINLSLLVFPHLLAARCWIQPSFFAALHESTTNADKVSSNVASRLRSRKSD